MKERYTSEEIWYEDAGVNTLGNDQLRHLIARVLSRVPRDVATHVLENCLFLMPMFEYEYGFYLQKELLQNKSIIALPEKLLEKPEKHVTRIVLHEIAHFYLGHKSLFTSDLSDEVAKEQEEEADSTADMWLRESEIDSKQKRK